MRRTAECEPGASRRHYFDMLSFDMLSFFMPLSFDMLSFDMLSFFMPLSFDMLSLLTCRRRRWPVQRR
jgi:hypothetical protein